MNTLDLARRFHALGFSIIPLQPRSKQSDGEWKPYQTTRCTDADLVQWFGNGVPRNIGLVLGAVSGFVVIESDTPESEAWCVANLADTPMKVRSARGFHRYYVRPSGVVPEAIPAFIKTTCGQSIEVKRDGQYVVAPGSVHPSGHVYAMVEDWPATVDNVPLLDLTTVFDGTAHAHNAAAPLPSSIGQGQRNSTLWTEACRMRRLGFDADEIFAALQVINRKRCSPPEDDAALRDLARRAAKYAPAADLFPLSEAGDAEYFASVHGDALRFDHLRGRWLLFTSHVWTPQSDGEITRLALDAIRARQRAAIGNSDRIKWAARGESRSRLTNQLALAQNVKPIADAGETWDLDPWLLGVGNGVVDLRSGMLRAGRAEDRITMRTSMAYDPAASAPEWTAFLASVFDADVVAYMQRAAGYSLTGDCREECLFFCWGAGANGKGTFMNTLAYVLGDYADDLPFSALELQTRSNTATNDIAKLVGKRYVTASESGETTRLNEARVKALTGRDPITARFLHREFFTFHPMAKFWLATNRKPIVRDDSAGFWRRLHLIPFTRTFEGCEDKTLKDRLRAEASGILAWSVQGCLLWQREGLNAPDVVRRATDEYRRESDSLSPFYDTCCVLDPQARVKASDLYKRYLRWCEDTHVWPENRLSLTAFGKQVKARFASEERRHTTYVGIGLRAEGYQEGVPF